ncbi:MAG: hypothetical protein JNG90_18695 [Planctomycetaceae bacterium]|nr:hypothetical protein [Planctomycetaceae bacterium]
MKSVLVILVLLVSLCAIASPALAGHRHRSWRHAQRRGYVTAYPLVIVPNGYGGGYFGSGYYGGGYYGGYGVSTGFASPFVDPQALGYGPFGY